jgi:hypothetical protein
LAAIFTAKNKSHCFADGLPVNCQSKPAHLQTKPLMALALLIFSAVISVAQSEGEVVGVLAGDGLKRLHAINESTKFRIQTTEQKKPTTAGI